ncbi:MAG TPA: hypothetical protein VGL93_31905 [Streptosporangiaceae bacterium]|jgi:hypothetical protein
MTTTLPQTAKGRKAAAGTTGTTGPRTEPRVKPRTDPAAKPKTRPARESGARPASRAPRTPFVLLIVGLLGGALISLLLLNTVLAEDAFRLDDLQRQNTTMLQQEQALKVEVNKAEAPGALAQRARQLGMRPGPTTPRFADAQHATTPGGGQKAKPRATPNTKPRHAASHTPRTAKPVHHRAPKTRHSAGPTPSTSGGGGAFAGGGR